MPDVLTPLQRHNCMSRVRSASTKLEITLRKELWRKGYRYRNNDRRFPGTPDIVLPKYHSVIFVQGCFWHGHTGCKKSTPPKTNTTFWGEKIARNKQRDEDVWRQLEAKGWFVIIVWGCELGKNRIDSTISRIESELLENGREFQRRREERKLIRQQHILETKEKQNHHRILLAEIMRL